MIVLIYALLCLYACCGNSQSGYLKDGLIISGVLQAGWPRLTGTRPIGLQAEGGQRTRFQDDYTGIEGIRIDACSADGGRIDHEKIADIRIDGQQHYADQLGNIYVVNGSEIRRLNREFKDVSRYSNAYLGQVAGLDVSDPLRILVFYRDYNQILWLDHYLAGLRSPVRLDELGHELVELVCSSSQDGFWIYDNLTDQLISFDAGLNAVHESINLRPMLDEYDIPVYMTEKNRNIYLNFPRKGIFVFDRFGNYQKIIPLTGISRFQVREKYIYYPSGTLIIRYDLEDGSITETSLPAENPPLYAEWQAGLLYLYYNSRISVYRQ